MKKFLLTITFILSLFLLTGCEESPIKNLKYADFQKKIANKETFILEVMQDGCSHCESFTPKFEKVLKEHSITAYSLNLAKLAKVEREEFNNNYEVDGTPTVLFFKDGQESSILNRINGDKDKSVIISKLKTNGYIK